jgi:hypothetical protein
MTTISEPDLLGTIQVWDQAAWCLAALALAARDDFPPELSAAAGELLAATGLTAAPGGPLRGLGTSTPRRSPARRRPRCTRLPRWSAAATSAGTPKR